MEDNTALNAAMNAQNPVLPVFIFDEDILNELPESDARVSFIYDVLHRMNITLQAHQSSLLSTQRKPRENLGNDLHKLHCRQSLCQQGL